MKLIRIIAFVAGTIAAALIGGRAFSLVMELVGNLDARGNYWTDSIGLTAAATAACLIVVMLLIFLLKRTLYGRRPIRMLVVFGGYLGACLGAALTLAAILWTVAAVSRGTMPPLTIVVPSTLYAGILIGAFTLPPALAFIAVAEWTRIRAPVFYAIAGVAAAILAYILYMAFLSLPGTTIGTLLGVLCFSAYRAWWAVWSTGASPGVTQGNLL